MGKMLWGRTGEIRGGSKPSKRRARGRWGFTDSTASNPILCRYHTGTCCSLIVLVCGENLVSAIRLRAPKGQAWFPSLRPYEGNAQRRRSLLPAKRCAKADMTSLIWPRSDSEVMIIILIVQAERPGHRGTMICLGAQLSSMAAADARPLTGRSGRAGGGAPLCSPHLALWPA